MVRTEWEKILVEEKGFIEKDTGRRKSLTGKDFNSSEGYTRKDLGRRKSYIAKDVVGIKS